MGVVWPSVQKEICTLVESQIFGVRPIRCEHEPRRIDAERRNVAPQAIDGGITLRAREQPQHRARERIENPAPCEEDIRIELVRAIERAQYKVVFGQTQASARWWLGDGA